MPRVPQRNCRFRFSLAAVLVLLSVAQGVSATDSRQASGANQDALWREGIEAVGNGHFDRANTAFGKIQTSSPLTDRVRSWLEEYQAGQEKRRKQDQAEFDMYVGYAQARIERKEYQQALRWTLAALDCTHDREAYLKSDWLVDLSDKALLAAEGFRKDADWRKAWEYYWRLSSLYEREPRYKKLERDALTHLRLDVMFKEGSHWQERLEKVRWEDAEAALECLSLYYVEPPDFKRVTESALEHVLLLAESTSAREQFEGLANDDDRQDFVSRVKRRLELVRSDPDVDLRDAKRHLRRVVKTINKDTVRLPRELVVSELMRGALEPTDDFTTIIWPQDVEDFDKHTRGNFVGVGISIIKNRLDEIEVVTPMDGGSAYRAGIQAGDVITHVNGNSLKEFSLNKVVDTITGPKNTEVTLTIHRGEDNLEFPLMRKNVKIQSVKGYRRQPGNEEKWDHWIDKENGIGYIRLTNFQRNTVEDVENVLSELQAGALKGLVLDLRGNPGGLLDSAWRMSKLFLRQGEKVVSTKGRNRGENQELLVSNTGAFSDLPLTVLVDESSASASEIVAGAIHDNHHGTVIGARTFGKFSVQNLIPLNHHRSNAKLKITTAAYYLPSGASLHRKPTSEVWGVDPDIPLRLVRWERLNLRKMWRAANLLGPAKPEVKVNPDEEKDAKGGKWKAADAKGDKDEGKDEGKDVTIADSDPKDDVKADDKDSADKGAADKDGDSAEVADAKDSKEEELPPLDQPDENTRPMEDPQLDTALLFMRIRLLGERFPTIASAEAVKEPATAAP